MEFESGPAIDFERESGSGLFDELQELELAVRLLDVVNETQLDRLLRGLVQQAEAAAGGVMAPSAARALSGLLQTVVRQIWQRAGVEHTAGNIDGSVGAEFGRRLSSVAGPILGLELEGLSDEDREFEAARQFVRLAGEAVRNAVTRGAGAHPRERVHRAVSQAAEVYAPGLTVLWDRAPSAQRRRHTHA